MISADSRNPLPIACLFNLVDGICVESGFVYFPLLFDEDIERDLTGEHVPDDHEFLVEMQSQIFIKGFSISSLLRSYRLIAPESYQEQKNKVYEKYPFLKRATEIPITEKLCTIIFEILPYFVSKSDKKSRKKYTREDILDLISRNINVKIPPTGEVENILNIGKLKHALNRLTKIKYRERPDPEGIVGKVEFEEWFFYLLERQIVNEEKSILEETIRRREKFARVNRRVLSVLLAVAEKGALEIDGFGFYETRLKGEFIVYRRTGEYALQDYYGRTYLFPDCRVAISTNGSLDPFVLENYKHPFLQKHAPAQKICMRKTVIPARFSARNAIFAIEEGINALMHGYDYRRRNGYHSLDSMPLPGGSVNFEDYMVPRSHPKIKEGKVQITNEFR